MREVTANDLAVFIIGETDKRKAARRNVKQVRWTNAKIRRASGLAAYILETAQKLYINPFLLCEIILNKLFPVNKPHVPFTRVVTAADDYIDSLADTTLDTLRTCKNWRSLKPIVVTILNEWNSFARDKSFASMLASTTGATYTLMTAYYYGADFLPALNLLLKYTILYAYSNLNEFSKKYFKAYVILGCRYYKHNDSFRQGLHFYHIAANAMPNTLLPKLKVSKMFKLHAKKQQKRIQINFKAVIDEIRNKFGVETFPEIITPLMYKRIRSYPIFLSLFYDDTKLPLGSVRKRKPIATLPPSLFKSVNTPIQIKVEGELTAFTLIGGADDISIH